MTLSGSSIRCAAASRAVTTEAPHKRESRRGRIPKEPLALYEGGPVTLCSQPKSSPFWNLFLLVCHQRRRRCGSRPTQTPLLVASLINATALKGRPPNHPRPFFPAQIG